MNAENEINNLLERLRTLTQSIDDLRDALNSKLPDISVYVPMPKLPVNVFTLEPNRIYYTHRANLNLVNLKNGFLFILTEIRLQNVSKYKTPVIVPVIMVSLCSGSCGYSTHEQISIDPSDPANTQRVFGKESLCTFTWKNLSIKVFFS